MAVLSCKWTATVVCFQETLSTNQTGLPDIKDKMNVFSNGNSIMKCLSLPYLNGGTYSTLVKITLLYIARYAAQVTSIDATYKQ